MQILGYEILKTHLYIIGGLGLSSRLALSLVNQAYDKTDKKKERKTNNLKDDRPIVKVSQDSNDYCLIINEDGDKTNSLLLDDITLVVGESSEVIRLLYLEKNTTYIIYGNFIAFNKTWRFQSTKVEYYDNDSCKKVNCSNIQSVSYRPNSKFTKNNLGKFAFSAFATNLLDTDFDNDGDSDLGDALLGGILGQTLFNLVDNDTTYGLKLDKHTTIKLMK